MSVIQIFGSKKCRDTQKAERFFKERGIKYQFIDLAEKGMSPGELDSVRSVIPLEKLINLESKEFSRLNLAFMKFDILEKLLEYPLLLNTPVVRRGKSAACGFDPAGWEKIAELD